MKLFEASRQRRDFLCHVISCVVCFLAPTITVGAGLSVPSDDFKKHFEKLQIGGKNVRISGQFVQTKRLKALDLSLDSKGQFAIQVTPGKRQLEWRIQDPSAFLVCMGEGKIVLSGQQTQSIKMGELDAKNFAQIEMLMNLLGMDFDYLHTRFNIAKENDWFVLVPNKAQDFVFERIRLLASKGGNLQRVQLFEKTKDEVDILFSKVTMVNLQKTPVTLACLN